MALSAGWPTLDRWRLADKYLPPAAATGPRLSRCNWSSKVCWGHGAWEQACWGHGARDRPTDTPARTPLPSLEGTFPGESAAQPLLTWKLIRHYHHQSNCTSLHADGSGTLDLSQVQNHSGAQSTTLERIRDGLEGDSDWSGHSREPQPLPTLCTGDWLEVAVEHSSGPRV